MEKKLTKEEIERVFAMYCPCIAFDIVAQKNVHITGVLFDEGMAKFEVEDNYEDYGNIDNFLPLLTPLSMVSDEEAIEVAKLLEIEGRHSSGRVYINGVNYCELNGIDLTNWIKAQLYHLVRKEWQIREYLISKGYAVPLWFGVGHWANGKTAIELGIAVEQGTQEAHTCEDFEVMKQGDGSVYGYCSKCLKELY